MSIPCIIKHHDLVLRQFVWCPGKTCAVEQGRVVLKWAPSPIWVKPPLYIYTYSQSYYHRRQVVWWLIINRIRRDRYTGLSRAPPLFEYSRWALATLPPNTSGEPHVFIPCFVPVWFSKVYSVMAWESHWTGVFENFCYNLWPSKNQKQTMTYNRNRTQ